MNMPMIPGATMTSTALLDLINDSRAMHGEPAVRRNDFISRCKDELEGDHYESFVVQNLNKTESEELRLSRDQCLLVAMRESKGVRRRVVEKLNAMDRPMTQAELIAASANHMVDLERRQAAQQQALDRLGMQVVEHDQLLDDLSRSTVWNHCPQNCWSLSAVKLEMNKRYGLSGPVVDFVLKGWMHLPNPAGMVKNSHEEARGSQYLVWSKTNVSAAFKRFVSGCQMVTATQATHPDIEGRFQLRLKGAV
nr:phage antirepressor [uncultured Pseudomonas sp.]